MKQYVQYGCGLSAPPGWLNFDVSPSLVFQRFPLVGRWFCGFGPAFPKEVRFGDIVGGLPLEPGSCDGIYCSHVLEHLSFDDALLAIEHTFSYLRCGGRFRMVLPDLEHLARVYLESEEISGANNFMQNSGLGQQKRARSLPDFFREWLGNSRHRWMWDYKSLGEVLSQAGFSEIRRAESGDSKDERFRDVEEGSRWKDCLGIECMRLA